MVACVAEEVLDDVSMLDEMEKVDEDEDEDLEEEEEEEEEEDEGGAVDSQASQGEGSVQEGESGAHKRSFSEVFGEHEEGSDDEEDELGGKRDSGRDEEEEEDDDDASASKRPIFKQQQEPMSSGYTLSSASGLLRLLERWRGLPTPFVVVLDDADQLSRESVHVLQELLELPRTLRAPRVALTVVFVSHDPMILPGGSAMALQLTVPFPSYTKAEIITILQRVVSEAVGFGEGSGAKVRRPIQSSLTPPARQLQFRAHLPKSSEHPDS
jgi:Cdc6-like AAA superfamily ATPase